jgi:diphosphomevalonate decarboxylase
VKATAVAHPNIALVKYWGKRDDALVLPHQSSFSVTLGPLSVTATVEPLLSGASSVEINGAVAEGRERDRVLELIHKLRPGAAVRVATRGDFPAGAGLASSAAAFAALAVAARAAFGLERDVVSASRLARLGSGSASRSIQGGFCRWRRGERADGEDSFAEQTHDERHWPDLRLLVAVVSRDEKEVSSRDGMKATVETSPYYASWISQAERDVPEAIRLVQARDLEALGALAERNAWRMHATALAAHPPLCYLLPATLSLINALPPARKSGLPVWFTLDAGPNPVLLTTAENVEGVTRLARAHGACSVIPCAPGHDARPETHPLF